MIAMTFAGIDGKQYENFDEAWASFYQELYGEEVMGSQRYHELYFIFLSGAISSLNIQGTKMKKRQAQNMGATEAAARGMMETLNEAMRQGIEEYKQSGFMK
jgi:hypothetical protein